MNNELLFVLIVMMMLFSKSLQSDLKNGTFFAILFMIGILPLGLLTMTQISKAHSEKEIIELDSIFTNSNDDGSNTKEGSSDGNDCEDDNDKVNPCSLSPSHPLQAENNVEIKRQVKDT